MPSPLTTTDELTVGLLAPTAHIAPKYFYNDLGSRLFAAITELREYYLPKCERTILRDCLSEMIAATGTPHPTWIDLGSGDCTKSAALFAALQPATYVAVDIAKEFLRESLACLQRLHPAVQMLGVATDFADALHVPHGVPTTRRVFFYPGSSIGNFAPDAAVTFLRGVREQCDHEGALWIGVDLHKDKSVLEPAYNDALGVTAAFNKNILLHVNARLGSDFELAHWDHVAHYQTDCQRIEMHLQANRPCRVRWPNGERSFVAGERIHTENSYKYDLRQFGALLRSSGWHPRGHWTDEKGRFAVFVAGALP